MRFTTTTGSFACLALASLLAACSAPASDASAEPGNTPAAIAVPEGLAPGSNEMLRAPITSAPELEVIISDVIIPPGAEVPTHYHPGEEFVYVIEGSALHVEEGKEDRVASAGDTIVIAPEAVHAPRGGDQGARAIVFRVHVKDQPERIPVTEE